MGDCGGFRDVAPVTRDAASFALSRAVAPIGPPAAMHGFVEHAKACLCVRTTRAVGTTLIRLIRARRM
jgi:hypothetical protein